MTTLAKARVGWLFTLTTTLLLLLVLLLDTTTRGASAFLFLQLPPSSIQSSRCRSQHPRDGATTSRTTAVAMISQKEKRRLAEQQDRMSALQKAEIVKRQRQLVTQLQRDVLPSTTKNKKTAATAANKLLKNVAHDGLEDIGSEARAIVLNLFYQAQRPADVLSVLSSDSSSVKGGDDDEEVDELLYAKYALWAHALNEEWQSAVPYSIQLYDDDDDEKDYSSKQQDKNDQAGGNNNSRPPFSSPDEKQQLRRAAVRALTRSTDQKQLDLARQLLQPERDGGTAVIADMFESYIRNRLVDEARLFWDELEQKQVFLDQEMYRKLLKLGSEMADIPWMERATEALESETASDRLLLLQGLAAGSEESKLTLDHQALVVTAMERILNASKPSKTEKGAMLRLLDRLWLAVDQPDKQKELFWLCEQYFGDKHSWIISLPAAAKARIFPLLVEEAKDDDGHQAAWKILVSLVPSPVKSSPEKVQSFVQKQSAEFCSAAFALFMGHYFSSEFGKRLSNIIVENRWHDLLPQPSDDPTESKQWKRVGYLFNFVGYFSGENKFEVFEKAVANLTMFVTTHMSTTTTSQKSKEMEFPPRPSFADPRRESLVDSNARFWQALVHVDSALWENADFCFGVRLVSSAAMKLVASHTKIDNIHNDFTTLSDGQAKEAIDTIMKDVLTADLLPQYEVAAVGREYYLSLARICRTLSIDDQKCLLFPRGAKTAIVSGTDPYEVFRECVLGGKSKLKEPILKFILSWVDDDGGTTNQRLVLLLPSVVMMTYGESKTYFIEEYQRLFKSFDLFLDSRLLKEFFSALGFARVVSSALTDLPNLPNMPTDKDKEESLWFKPLWTSQLASAVVEEVCNGQYVQKLVKDMDGVRDFDEKTSLLTGYVCNMYSAIGPFSSYSDQAATSLYDRYRRACDVNCQYIVEYLVNQSSKEMSKVQKSRKQKKEAPWKRLRRSSREQLDKVVDHVIRMMELMLEQISNIFQEEDFDGDDDDDYALPDGSHFVSLIVFDVLENLAWQLPPERLEQFFERVKSNRTIKEHSWLGVFVQEFFDAKNRK